MMSCLIVVLTTSQSRVVCVCYPPDNNECETNNGGCQHLCNNTLGSFECRCNPGFSLDSNLLDCTGEQWEKVLFPGSPVTKQERGGQGSMVDELVCAADSDYSREFLSPDNNECTDGTANCQQTCTNTLGSFQCNCTSGFTLDSDGRACNGESTIHKVWYFTSSTLGQLEN